MAMFNFLLPVIFVKFKLVTCDLSSVKDHLSLDGYCLITSVVSQWCKKIHKDIRQKDNMTFGKFPGKLFLKFPKKLKLINKFEKNTC